MLELGHRKAISPTRDLLQSRALTSIVGATLAILGLLTFHAARALSPAFLIVASTISILFALLVSHLRAATLAGSLSGGMICLLLTFWTSSPTAALLGAQSTHTVSHPVLHTALTPLFLLFVCTFAATRSGRRHKTASGLAESRRGRSASQIIANLSAAALFAAISGVLVHHGYPTALNLTGRLLALAALAEATADTVSSEVGQAFGGQPRMLLTLQRVPIGTDGAVTTLGTVAGILAAALITLDGAWAMHLSSHLALAAVIGAIAGLFFDSLLGSTVERRGWIGNDLVNFSSTLFAAAAAALIARR